MTCRGCKTEVNERHATLRRASGNNNHDKAVAVYECPSCGAVSEAIPSPDQLRVWAILAKGKALQARGRLQEALGCFEHILSDNPESAIAWYNQGCVLGNLRRFREAAQCFDRALTLQPDYPRALNCKAGALEAQGKVLEAIDCCERVLVTNSDDTAAQQSKQGLLAKMGRNQ